MVAENNEEVKNNVLRPRKLVLFGDSPEHLRMVQHDLDHGWYIINIVKNERNYICILEKEVKDSESL